MSGSEDVPPSQASLAWSFASRVPEPSLPRWRVQLGDRVAGGRYLIESLLGQGGMGAVYLAMDEANGRRVALKLLAREITPQRLERFRREGELTAGLRHPGIVAVHDAGEFEGMPYLAYELVSGNQTLREALPGLEREAGVRLLTAAVKAVGHAHEHAVTHRDLKPENILVDPLGLPHVADFGLAQAEGLERLTLTGAMIGTPSYMAPEQLAGEREAMGPPTDVWALGVMLYEFLTGELPFRAENLLELSSRVITADPPRPRSVDRSIPADLEAVCLKALEKDPARRYPDARALAADLENALESRPVSASSWWVRRLSGPRQRRRVLGGVVLLTAAAAVVGAWRWGKAPPGEAELRRALGEFRSGQRTHAQLEPLAADARGELGGMIQLALAGEEAASVAELEDRLKHARSSRLLAPAKASRAWRIEAQTLAALGRYAEAAAAYGEAARDGTSEAAELLLCQGHMLFAAGALGPARSVVDRLAREEPDRPELRALRLRLALASGDLELASAHLAAYRRLDSGPRFEVLRSELAVGRGEDPLPLLEASLVRHPKSAELRFALAHRLALAEHMRAARRAIGDCAPDSLERQRLVRILDELGAEPPTWEAVAAGPKPLREAAGRWLFALGRREHAFSRRAEDPRQRPRPAGALPLAQRRTRAEQALRGAVALAPDDTLRGRAHALLGELAARGTESRREHARAALAALPDDPRALGLAASLRLEEGDPAGALELLDRAPESPELAWLRCQAVFEEGRSLEAESLLEALLAARADDLALHERAEAALSRAGRSGSATRVRARIELLRGAKREEAKAYVDLAGNEQMRQDDEARASAASYRRALELDPLDTYALYRLGQSLFLSGELKPGLRDSLLAIGRDPRLLADFCGTFLLITLARGQVGGGSLRDLVSELEGNDPRDAASRAFLSAGVVDFEQHLPWLERARKSLDGLLAADPALVWAYVLRAALHLRGRDLVRAEEDLRIAEEEAPDCGSVHFFQALLAATRREDPALVFGELDAARATGMEFARGDMTMLTHYTQFGAYADQPGFERYSTGH